MGLLDVIFPKRCVNCRKVGSYLCAVCLTYLSFDPEQTCLMCNRGTWDGLTHPRCEKKQGIDGSFSALAYKGSMKRLLFTYKYNPYVSDLTEILSDLFYEGIIQNEMFMGIMSRDCIIVPIPLHRDKLRTRGYNHAALLANGIGKRLGLSVHDIVIRTRKTKSQFSLKKEEREENLKGAFEVKPETGEAISGKTIFLLDDLVTTGTTLKEAAKVLKNAGAFEVYGLTLAHGH